MVETVEADTMVETVEAVPRMDLATMIRKLYDGYIGYFQNKCGNKTNV